MVWHFEFLGEICLELLTALVGNFEVTKPDFRILLINIREL